MRFTERELTVAVDRLAEQSFSASLPQREQSYAEETWRTLTPIQKYSVRSTVADFALPVLLALPNRPTLGAMPQFSDDEWAVATAVGLPHADDAHRRTALAMAQTALTMMPIRQDPDSIDIPDYI